MPGEGSDPQTHERDVGNCKSWPLLNPLMSHPGPVGAYSVDGPYSGSVNLVAVGLESQDFLTRALDENLSSCSGQIPKSDRRTGQRLERTQGDVS